MNPYVTSENIGEKTDEWLRKIAPFNKHEITPVKNKTALLVIDMQDFFLDNSSRFSAGGLAILPGIKKLISVFRDQGRPVIFTKHVHHPDMLDAGIMGWWWEGMCVEGSPASEIHSIIAPTSREKVITKHRYSAFYNTDLETILRVQQIEDLVITGVTTNLCCESTARDAYFRDFRTFFLADGTGTMNESMHLASLMNLSFGFSYVTTIDYIIENITNHGV